MRRDIYNYIYLYNFPTFMICSLFINSAELSTRQASRKLLLKLCQEVVVTSAAAISPRKAPKSASSTTNTNTSSSSFRLSGSPTSDLKGLQQERVSLSRLGFLDRIPEVDRRIESLRLKVQEDRDREETLLITERMKKHTSLYEEKSASLERLLAEEHTDFSSHCREEERLLLERQEKDFVSLLESASRRALGNIKKCECKLPYLCRHNRSSSGNLRRPSKEVTEYRRNAERLARADRWDEAVVWEMKADELDANEEKEWRDAVAKAVISAAWGAHEVNLYYVYHAFILSIHR